MSADPTGTTPDGSPATGVAPDQLAMTGASRHGQVTVVLVAYKTPELILKCLAGLPAGCPVIVVDNASGDGTAEAIAAAYPKIDLVRSPENLGFARAVNLAAARVRTPYLMLLNPDAEPVGDPVGALLDHALAHPAPGIYAGRTLRRDGSDDGRSVFGLPSLWGYLCFATGLSSVFRRSRLCNPEEHNGLDRAVGGPAPAVSGCVVLFERALFEELGGFDPRYFMYSEDVDLSWRAARLGRHPVLVAGATVTHENGASSSATQKRVMVLRGKVTFVRLRWSPVRARVGLGLIGLGVWLRSRVGTGWAEVWGRRAEWKAGWAAPASTAGAPATASPAAAPAPAPTSVPVPVPVQAASVPAQQAAEPQVPAPESV
ncbi:glycosyltransferase family 2 protein [Longispora sp. NPDC051575]|uniref:glycosyltransferase family 2 protein n=1 Tax=Longispora sp. NPDC051575 TaxID=3154943 RepID=UPI003419B0A5